MENTNTNTNNNNNSSSSSSSSSSTSKAPIYCTAGCGFYGSEAFNNMCSQCYKKVNQSKPSSSIPARMKAPSISVDDTNIIPSIEKSRKHLRSPSPEDPRVSSAPASSIASPASTAETSKTAASPASTDGKPVQINKGRCFKCRLKVPLAKQAANKCRCGYVFCDSHRYPDRHDCDIDYAKMDKEILAKNNPKLHERPRGGRSFQRIDSL